MNSKCNARMGLAVVSAESVVWILAVLVPVAVAVPVPVT